MKRKCHENFVSELKQSNPNINVVGKYINCSTKIEVCCSKCNHLWSATPNSLLRGSGCPKCANNQRKSHDRFVFEMEKYNPHVEILGTYNNSHTPLKVKCRICGNEWMCKPMRLLRGAQCQNCVKPHTSFMEQFILIAFQKVIGKDAVESRNTTAIGLELDIYIPNYKLAIEPGTWLYHRKKASNTDLHKRQECQKNGIRLITIYDTYPTNLPPPFEMDCYVFEGFLNEYGYDRMIGLIKIIMSNLNVDYAGLDWNQIANEAYANCHYNAQRNFINELNALYPNIEVLEEYKGANIPISVKNKTCEHPSWKARPETLLKGIGCPLCGRKNAAQSRTRSQEEFKDELQIISPSVEVMGTYTKVTDRINVRCKICGKEWSPLAYSLISGKGCPHCSAKKGAQARTNRLMKKSTDQFVDELKTINPNIIVNSEYMNNKTKINVECTVCGHIWDVVPASLLNGHGCPKCAKSKNNQN